MELNFAIERALDGEAILFVGAGFPSGATNIKNKPFKRGAEFSNYLAKLAGLTSDVSLDDAADAYLEAFSEDDLIKEIRDEFTAQRVKHYHRIISRVPWKRIYTTNYDNVLEVSYNLEKQKLVPITLDADPYTVPKNRTLCIHFNGFVDRLDRDSLGTQLKLTEMSYITSSITDSPWTVLFREDLRLAHGQRA